MVLDSAADTPLLLEAAEVPPVREENAAGRSPFLLTCDHYGRLIPQALGDLGLPASELTRHIAWDIGIAGVAEQLSKHLDAHLIAQRYSRLVIDCNRPPCVASSIPVLSEATTVPGNEGLTRAAAEARRAGDFRAVSSPHRGSDRPAFARGHADRAGVAAQLYAGLCRHRASLACRHAVSSRYAPAAAAVEAVPWRRRSGGRRQRALCGQRRDRLHHSDSRRGARADEFRHRNPPGPDRGPGRRAAMGGSAGADFCRGRGDADQATGRRICSPGERSDPGESCPRTDPGVASLARATRAATSPGSAPARCRRRS